MDLVRCYLVGCWKRQLEGLAASGVVMQRRGFIRRRRLGCEGGGGRLHVAEDGRLTAAGGGRDARLTAVIAAVALRSFLGPATCGGFTAVLLHGGGCLAFRFSRSRVWAVLLG